MASGPPRVLLGASFIFESFIVCTTAVSLQGCRPSRPHIPLTVWGGGHSQQALLGQPGLPAPQFTTHRPHPCQKAGRLGKEPHPCTLTLIYLQLLLSRRSAQQCHGVRVSRSWAWQGASEGTRTLESSGCRGDTGLGPAEEARDCTPPLFERALLKVTVDKKGFSQSATHLLCFQ